MARNDWRGDSQAVNQRERFTLAGVMHAGDTPTITINRKTVNVALAGTESFADAAAALAAAFEAATFPESKDCTVEYTDGNAYLDLVAANAGVPFTATASVAGGGATVTLTKTTITASAGPSHVDDANNWSLGTTPGATDDVVVAGGAAMLYGLGSFTVNSVTYYASYAEPVGLPKYNSGGYLEYRTRRLTWNTATGKVGTGPGTGSSQMFLTAVAASTWTVEKTGTRSDDTLPALDLSASGNVTAVFVSGGADVGIMVEDEATARTFATVRVTGADSRVTVGRASTVTNFDADAGTVDVYGTVTNPTIGKATYNQHEGNFTSMVARGGYIRLNHSGVGMTIDAQGRGEGDLAPVVDCESTNGAKTFANSTFRGGAVLYDTNKCVTLDTGGTHTADSTFFLNSRLPPLVTWNYA